MEALEYTRRELELVVGGTSFPTQCSWMCSFAVQNFHGVFGIIQLQCARIYEIGIEDPELAQVSSIWHRDSKFLDILPAKPFLKIQARQHRQ